MVMDTFKLIGLTDGSENFSAYGFSLGGRFLNGAGQSLQHHHEFVAAHPRHRVTLAYTSSDTLCYML